MYKEFMRHFRWVRELLDQEIDGDIPLESSEYAILRRLKYDWKEDNGIELLRALDENYGETARLAVAKFLKVQVTGERAAIGEKEAREGTEIDDFFRVLWEPLRTMGFEYTLKNENGVVGLKVTRCPIFELAEKTGMHEWFYSMACAIDYHTTPSFSAQIGFARTKSLMQGDECCNHSYYYKNAPVS